MKGFTLAELLIALALSLVVAAGALSLASDAHRLFASQPEEADLVQRARSGLDWLYFDLVVAGAGPHRGLNVGPLPRWLPAIHPNRRGVSGPDPEGADPEGAAFDDRITLLTVLDGAAHASLAGAVAASSTELPLAAGTECAPAEPACGFAPGNQVLLFDETGAFDLLGVDAVGPALLLHPPGQLSQAYSAAAGASIVQAQTVCYYLDPGRRQLRRTDGDSADVPVVDDVVELEFRYFGNPFPPREPWNGSETCVADTAGAPRLPVLSPTHGTLVELTPALLSDGPWCGVPPTRFDADLYRIRQVRVRVRVQASDDTLRGSDPRWFRVPGVATHPAGWVPDLEAQFDVTPRNLEGT